MAWRSAVCLWARISRGRLSRLWLKGDDGETWVGFCPGLALGLDSHTSWETFVLPGIPQFMGVVNLMWLKLRFNIVSLFTHCRPRQQLPQGKAWLEKWKYCQKLQEIIFCDSGSVLKAAVWLSVMAVLSACGLQPPVFYFVRVAALVTSLVVAVCHITIKFLTLCPSQHVKLIMMIILSIYLHQQTPDFTVFSVFTNSSC